MKKLNRKGFTLVELLAVIIILAIVVGISIPAVLTTTKNAKLKAFQAAADSAADWFDRQYQIATTGLDGTGLATLDQNFINVCDNDGNFCSAAGFSNDYAEGKGIIVAAGLKTENIAQMWVAIDFETGRTCITLYAEEDGDYYDVTEKNEIKSSSCQ